MAASTIACSATAPLTFEFITNVCSHGPRTEKRPIAGETCAPGGQLGGMNSGTSSPSSPGSELPSTGELAATTPPRGGRPDTDSGLALDPGDLGRQRRVDALHVAEQALGVGAQRVAHLAEVRHELEAFGTDAVGGGAGVLEQAAGPLLGLGARRSGGLARLGDDLRGAVLGPRDDRERLVGRGGRGRLRRRLPFRAQPRCLGLRQPHSVRRLLLAGAHPIVGRPLRLRDTRRRTRSSVSRRMRSAVSSAAAMIPATRSAARAALGPGCPLARPGGRSLEPDPAFSATPGW